MLLGGDEILRTQGGNNNAWCQDNETSWVDWTLADDNADFLRFVKQLIALRKRHPALRRRTFLRGGGSGHPPTSSGTASSPATPTSATTAARWPSPSTAAAATAPA